MDDDGSIRRISIHAPRVGSDAFEKCDEADYYQISIHAPRVGSDLYREAKEILTNIFQSTLPVWGATAVHHRRQPYRPISIHAPRVGSDFLLSSVASQWHPYFNPRSPCGERQQRCTISAGHLWRKGINLLRDFHFWGIEEQKHPAKTAFHARKSVRTSPGFPVCWGFAVTESGCPPADRCSCSRNAQPSSRIDSPDNRIGGCPSPGP